MDAPLNAAMAPRIWQVGALCRAIAESLDARFNPVAVRGELSGFSRAASGHWYFTLKDAYGQIRCAMFRRAALLTDFAPRDGELVEVQGRLGVYESRGDLQLIVETMTRAGQGALFEQFLQLKARLEAQGLFDSARKRPLPPMPRGIGLVTSPGAAALHDVATCLRRRVPHIRVVLAPAAVQGNQAPAELIRALESLYRMAEAGAIDVILLVRGGGSLEDLWAFNNEHLARAIVYSPVPIVCGVGHETDFTIADFCADLRAPTPTAAAELVAQPQKEWLGALEFMQRRLEDAALSRLDTAAQRLDQAAARMARHSNRAAQQQHALGRCEGRLRLALQSRLHVSERQLRQAVAMLSESVQQRLSMAHRSQDRLALRLQLLDPRLVLQRGYALLTDEVSGLPITSVKHTHAGQSVCAALGDGEVDLTVRAPKANPL